MKITKYELLGLVKDGKVPNKIKYDNMIWEYDGDYYCNKNSLMLEEYCNLTTSLNDEVEILEEENKIPKKIEEIANGDFLELPSTHDIMNKINEIIDYLKSKGE